MLRDQCTLGRFRPFLEQCIKRPPDALFAGPLPLGGGLGLFGGAGLEEVGVLDARQQNLQPRQRVFLHAAVDFRQL